MRVINGFCRWWNDPPDESDLFGVRIRKAYQVMRDFLWFKVKLGGDEFHHSLNIDSEAVLTGKRTLATELDRVAKARDRAHRLDLEDMDRRR